MSVTFNKVKAMIDVFISYIDEYQNTWKPSEEIKTREEGEQYDRQMTKITNNINSFRDRLRCELELQNIWLQERQAEALESIAASLKMLGEK